MAIKVQGNTVIDNNEKGAFRRINLGAYAENSRPTSPEEGDMIYDSTNQQFLFWNGTEWTN